jgi:hypothetical protein
MQLFTQTGTGSPVLAPAAILLAGSFLVAVLAVCGNKIAQNDDEARAAAKAETYCHLTQFEVFRYVLAAKLNAAKVAR